MCAYLLSTGGVDITLNKLAILMFVRPIVFMALIAGPLK